LSAVWLTIGALAVSTALLRAAGPVLLGGRELPEPARRIVGLVAPALLAALVVVETVGDASGTGIALDERVAGLAAAGAVLGYRRELLLPAVVTAALVTALLRAI